MVPLSLPAGWEAKITEQKKVYYVDHNTKQTFWDAPEEVPLAKGPLAGQYNDHNASRGNFAAFNPIPAAALAAAATAAMEKQYAAASERMAFERST